MKAIDALEANRWERWIVRAVELSRLCPYSDKAFAVGCVITDANGSKELSFGFSRESSPHQHAEESALAKISEARGLTLISSLEPCSTRLSGRRSCCELIIEAGISKVVFLEREPSTFVEGRGFEVLVESGMEVIDLSHKI